MIFNQSIRLIIFILKRITGHLASQLSEEILSFVVVALCFSSGGADRAEGRTKAGRRVLGAKNGIGDPNRRRKERRLFTMQVRRRIHGGPKE
nr:hypothetical protein Itr_chr08CG15860 [Ipomoea trifida]GMD87451.1 hypothetical protein Iba_chr14bCG15870 [Ipomoea batatas]GME09447.1 hypothetical protein Iba_scaffold8718CG0010 [Ipomoea batatas]